MKEPPDLDAIAAAVAADLESIAPDRRSGTIALRIVALLVRHQVKGFNISQSEAAEMLNVTQSAVSRAGDRAEEALAVYRRNHRTGEVIPCV